MLFNFDLNKLVTSFTPKQMRKGSFLDFLQSLISPVKRLHNELFASFYDDQIEKAKQNAQVLKLEKTLNELFGFNFEQSEIVGINDRNKTTLFDTDVLLTKNNILNRWQTEDIGSPSATSSWISLNGLRLDQNPSTNAVSETLIYNQSGVNDPFQLFGLINTKSSLKMEIDTGYAFSVVGGNLDTLELHAKDTQGNWSFIGDFLEEDQNNNLVLKIDTTLNPTNSYDLLGLRVRGSGGSFNFTLTEILKSDIKTIEENNKIFVSSFFDGLENTILHNQSENQTKDFFFNQKETQEVYFYNQREYSSKYDYIVNHPLTSSDNLNLLVSFVRRLNIAGKFYLIRKY